MTKETRLTITKFTEVGQRHYTARVSLNGETINVEYRYGSWMHVVDENTLREVKPFVAEALQEKMPRDMRLRACDRPKNQKVPYVEGTDYTQFAGTVDMNQEPVAVLG